MADISQLKREIENFKREEEECNHDIPKKESELRHLEADITELKNKLSRAKRKQDELKHDLEKAEREEQKKKEEGDGKDKRY
ncbi:MAG TPA: hypothetical protein VF385_03490 [Patescibacteria group bacterium]